MRFKKGPFPVYYSPMGERYDRDLAFNCIAVHNKIFSLKVSKFNKKMLKCEVGHLRVCVIESYFPVWFSWFCHGMILAFGRVVLVGDWLGLTS